MGKNQSKPKVVLNVELGSYIGEYTAIARYPFHSEDEKSERATFTFTRNEYENQDCLTVVYKSYKEYNQHRIDKDQEGILLVKDKVNGKLQLTLANTRLKKELDKQEKTDCYLVDMGLENSNYMIIINSDHNVLWILSRLPQLPVITYSALKSKLEREMELGCVSLLVAYPNGIKQSF